MKDAYFNKFWNDGYLHIKSVFSEEEIKFFRNKIIENNQKNSFSLKQDFVAKITC